MSRIILSHLDINTVKDPEDSKVLASLDKIPFFKDFLNKTIIPLRESYNEVEAYGDGWNITQESAPEIYGCLKDACDILGISKVPKLTSEWFYFPSVSSAGRENLRIVIPSGTIDLLDEDELGFFLGHELGHFLCGHKPYQMLLETFYTPFIDDPSVKVWSTIVRIPLLDWYRKSDFSADRVGLLCCQNIETALRVMIKRAGLPKKYHNQINTKAFLQQARDFENLHADKLDDIAKTLSLRSCQFPWMVQRASKLYDWYRSGEYNRIINENR